MPDAPRRKPLLPPLPPRDHRAEAAIASLPPRPKSPCWGQTRESIAAWLRAQVTLGTEVVIRETQHGMLYYQLGRVVHLGKSRFQVARQRPDGTFPDTGEGFYYSGKNCWHPKGQTHLIVPTPEVVAACVPGGGPVRPSGDPSVVFRGYDWAVL